MIRHRFYWRHPFSQTTPVMKSFCSVDTEWLDHFLLRDGTLSDEQAKAAVSSWNASRLGTRNHYYLDPQGQS